MYRWGQKFIINSEESSASVLKNSTDEDDGFTCNKFFDASGVISVTKRVPNTSTSFLLMCL